MAKRKWTDEELRAAVRGAQTFSAIVEALQVDNTSDNLFRIRRRILALGIDTSHVIRERMIRDKRRRRWSDEDLRAAVAASHSFASTIRKLGLIAAGGNYESVQRRVSELRIDTSHFIAGFTRETRSNGRPAFSLEQVLVAGRWTSSHLLKRRLFRAGLKQPRCELCGWAQQAPDGRVPVELDHINGDKHDNRFENLRILCPNCHSLQPTHRGLNQARARKH